VLAVAGLVLSRGWFWSDWIGYSEGLLIGLTLWAIERHLDGRHRQALVLGFLATLLRAEMWPFVAAYALWLWLRQPGTRRLTLVLAALVPAQQFVADPDRREELARMCAQPVPEQPVEPDGAEEEQRRQHRERVVVDLVQRRHIGVTAEFADFARHGEFGHPGHELLSCLAIGDQIGYRDPPQAMAFGEAADLRAAHHGAVVIDEFADHADRLEIGQTAEVDGGLGLAHPPEEPAGPGAPDGARAQEGRPMWAAFCGVYGACPVRAIRRGPGG